ncbi:hypothetical protein U5A82_04420 [Sphingobium sp. CR2-8]|uniref:hypothetical protein n=1 Tax=Sphingobium sp. CR2-8 TaxID=1306534 RepID=UPI002DB85216|nr:hypothetical protein [Sphingobium sp. CR2-8]MEC3909737.1 hypothetical protein [Sphingobium sp. CR2-8]
MTDQISAGSVLRSHPLYHEVAAPLAAIIDPQPLIRSGRNWTLWAGPLVSILILAVALHQFRDLDRASLWMLMPTSPLFWMAFVAYYTAGPVSEWVIFRRLWSIPASGFGALLRKLVSNEILLGYLGEVYFYAWARRSAAIKAAPFGALKDVTILSALVGNVVTLAMLAIAIPLFDALPIGVTHWEITGSILFVLATSLIAMLLRHKLFALPRADLWFVSVIHLLRIVATTLLAAGMWHVLLPSVDVGAWILLATLRQLISRLPLLPNKDVVFAGMAAFLIGRDNEIVSAMALMATLILAAHLVVGIALGASGLRRGNRA